MPRKQRQIFPAHRVHAMSYVETAGPACPCARSSGRWRGPFISCESRWSGMSE